MKFLSLFAGIGGFDLGLERAGMECAGQVEIDPYCNKVLTKHWPNTKRTGDIRNVTKDTFGAVDLICGGFPCQPFSQAGKRKGKKDDRYLWPEMLRVLQEYESDWFIGENVPGIINMELDKVLFDLEGQGYETQTFIIPACAVDAPHRRDRVWIVGYSGSQSAGGNNSRTSSGIGMEVEKRILDKKGRNKSEHKSYSSSKDVADSDNERPQGSQQHGTSEQGEGAPRPTAECGKDGRNEKTLANAKRLRFRGGGREI